MFLYIHTFNFSVVMYFTLRDKHHPVHYCEMYIHNQTRHSHLSRDLTQTTSIIKKIIKLFDYTQSNPIFQLLQFPRKLNQNSI